MKRLAIITTHPIQYYAPIFRLLHERGRVAIKVFYTWGEAALNKYDPGFQRPVVWDTPLLEGYPYEWAVNVADAPGSHHFKGIITPALNKQINDWKPDALLVFGWAYKAHLTAIKYFNGKIPVFFRGDSTLLDTPTGVRSMLKKIFLRWVYNRIDCAFYVGTNNKAYYKAYGLSEDRLVFAPHAIDNDTFSVAHKQKALELRDKLNLPADVILILFAGKFEEKKNPLCLLKAFDKLDNAKLHLLFVGNGMLEDELKTQAGNNARIHFMGFQNQSAMPAIYQAADIFCLPSAGPGETWGLAVNEAMAAGKAIVVSDKVGCAADLVKQNINGEVFKSPSADALADTLKRMTSSKTELQQMGQQSVEIIKVWNFKLIAEAIEERLNQH